MTTNMTTPKIDFLGYRYWCFAFSLLLLAVFVGGALYKYHQRGSVFVYSVDFTGGTQLLVDFSKPVNSETVLQILEKNGFSGAAAREFSDHEVLVRVKEFEGDPKGLGQRMQGLLEADLSDTKVAIVQTDSVGAGVGAELRQNTLWAIIISLIGMLLYIWLRFTSLSYGVASIVALVHDVVVILSFVMWFDYEVSMNVVGAVLFVLGYSMNDTIVIFARIRENIAKHKGVSVTKLVNLSINETLRRTLLTSFATTLMVGALVVFGGEFLRLLSVSVLIGIVFGTYSSIYIASPVMLLLYNENK